MIIVCHAWSNSSVRTTRNHWNLLLANERIDRSTLVVRTPGADGYKLFGLDDVGGQVVAVDATGIEADRFLPASRLGRRPVSEEHRLLAMVDVVPRSSLFTLTIRPKRSQSRQVAGRLRMKLDIRTQPRMDHQMRTEIDRKR